MSSTLERERTARPWVRTAEMAGCSDRLPNLLAALGYHQPLRLEEMNGRRIGLAERYSQAFASGAGDPPSLGRRGRDPCLSDVSDRGACLESRRGADATASAGHRRQR